MKGIWKSCVALNSSFLLLLSLACLVLFVWLRFNCQDGAVKISNVKEIDHEHTELVDILNRLNEALKHNASREEIYRIIDDVIAFSRLHFRLKNN